MTVTEKQIPTIQSNQSKTKIVFLLFIYPRFRIFRFPNPDLPEENKRTFDQSLEKFCWILRLILQFAIFNGKKW